jgi:uncharacterized protein
MTSASPNSLTSLSTLTHEDYDQLDTILDDLRTRDDEIPQWEFCEGFMAAVICCRRTLQPQEYFEVLLGSDPSLFADDAQRESFMALWQRRWTEVATALDKQVESLEDEAAYQPEIMDIRGAVAALSEEERAEMAGQELPALGQIWALGFMFAVENWPEEWAPPKDKEAAEWLDTSLQAMVAMTEDDTEEPALNAFGDDGPPTVSQKRLNDFGDAIWAVYDLREIWRSIGPRVEQVRREAQPGRNDACPCGSGKKYKKCHGLT